MKKKIIFLCCRPCLKTKIIPLRPFPTRKQPLAFLAESEVDVVVTDMKMPRVSGREDTAGSEKGLAAYSRTHRDGLRLNRKRCRSDEIRRLRLYHQAFFQMMTC